MSKCNSNIIRGFASLLSGLLVCGTIGCTSFMAPIQGVPASRLPNSFLAQSRNNLVELGLARLSQRPSDEYQLDAGDILGIYVEGVLPPAVNEDELAPPPPVNFPGENSDLPPSVGYPIPVRDDGTLALPLIDPINVSGMSMAEAEREVRKAYTEERKILQPGQDRIIVTLMEERTVRVIVVREDLDGSSESSLKLKNGQLVTESTGRGTGHVLDLPAYKNDLMHALAETGGLPGLNAKNEIKVLRRSEADPRERDAFVRAFYSQYRDQSCLTPPTLPDDPSTKIIPLRYSPDSTPSLDEDDVVLRNGDIVYIESREKEFFYTGGLLPGGQFPIPRDYDLDVLGAMAIAGQGVAAGRRAGGGGGTAILGSGFGGAVPTQLYVFRKLPNGKEITIAVDLVDAMNRPGQRLLVQPGDTLLLRYKAREELLNFGLIGFFTYGIRELVR